MHSKLQAVCGDAFVRPEWVGRRAAASPDKEVFILNISQSLKHILSVHYILGFSFDGGGI